MVSRVTPNRECQDQGGVVFYFGGFFIEKTDRSSAPCDGPSWVVSNTAIESFWRCLFVEIWPFLWSICDPGGLRGVPGGPQGRARGSSGTSQGSQGRARASQGLALGSQGRARGSQRRPRGSQGRALGSHGRRRGSQGRAQGIARIPGGFADVPGIPGSFS